MIPILEAATARQLATALLPPIRSDAGLFYWKVYTAYWCAIIHCSRCSGFCTVLLWNNKPFLSNSTSRRVTEPPPPPNLCTCFLYQTGAQSYSQPATCYSCSYYLLPFSILLLLQVSLAPHNQTFKSGLVLNPELQWKFVFTFQLYPLPLAAG
jgi:hypothetical protein